MTNIPKGETPRTDALLLKLGIFYNDVGDTEKEVIDHARHLERELNEMTLSRDYALHCIKSSVTTPPSSGAGDVDEVVSKLYRRFKEWSARGFGPDDVTWCEVKAELLELIAATPAQGWMPIETAPKDGTEILGALKTDNGYTFAVMAWEGTDWQSTDDCEPFCCRGWYCEPTHWQPLPLPPKPEAKGDE